MKPAWILFDLGGVLVDWTGPQQLRRLLPAMPEDEYAQRWRTCRATDRFERGELSPLEFARHFAADWGLSLAPDAMLDRYVEWLRGFYPGAQTLLAGLRQDARLACLSNTNAAHWESLTGQTIRAEFEMALASHELRLRKPQPEIFALALQRLGAAAHEVLYFDDLILNVEAARAAGMNAHHVVGLPAVRQHLAELGLIHG